MTVLLAATAAILAAVGTYLVMQRQLSRIIIGLALFTHSANILLITAGRRGIPPLIGEGPVEVLSDPLPQALALTAIVITFAVTMLLLALAFRSWILSHDDEVEDDVGDRDVLRARILRREVEDQEFAMTTELGDEGL